MSMLKNLLTALAFVALLMMPVRAASDGEGAPRLTTPLGDIAFEVVGQVSNPSPTTSQQYGYLSLVNGLGAEQIFTTATPAGQNETTALFTFFTDAITERVIINGRLRIVNRTGTTTIYHDDSPDGNFADRETFRDGTPIVTIDYRQQVILDTVEGTFTVVNLNRVISSEAFTLGGEKFRLGKARDQFRVFYSGAPPTGTPAGAGVFAGYAVAIGRAERSEQ